MMHHYVSSVLAGITVTWGGGECYQNIRKQFVIFYFYLSVVQLLQCRYQTGCLRRLRALGQRHSMDISVGKNTLCISLKSTLTKVLKILVKSFPH
ncbi:unnamed protein product [Gongylonema pulchrum]|uniref:Secreted protein n=1 Tax=Gongylonema pulchrum TaxID=637853 RepID=A0A183E561_9BILA|nr:unnamed protein product [Gongylonema pulchrum]